MRRRKKRTRWRKARVAPPLTAAQILAWADAHYQRTGRWPKNNGGRLGGPVDETWKAIDAALRVGVRGLPGGSSLARLLAERRGVRNKSALPRLTAQGNPAWADAHHRRTGQWPTTNSGPVTGAPGETWPTIDSALRAGLRGLPGGSSLARLLAERRGVRNPAAVPPLRVETILAWADAHRRREGEWPRRLWHCVTSTNPGDSPHHDPPPRLIAQTPFLLIGSPVCGKTWVPALTRALPLADAW